VMAGGVGDTNLGWSPVLLHTPLSGSELWNFSIQGYALEWDWLGKKRWGIWGGFPLGTPLYLHLLLSYTRKVTNVEMSLTLADSVAISFHVWKELREHV